ncbi:UNVERIFIED_CONTAM: hypothetical protein Sradi_4970400 [Sesamum radiatum]|uniref:Uncharacterized protein n=1 Tax=Sesamum radiatum TaxID=300843 RepID=A0AAW2MED3_SESRA
MVGAGEENVDCLARQPRQDLQKRESEPAGAENFRRHVAFRLPPVFSRIVSETLRIDAYRGTLDCTAPMIECRLVWLNSEFHSLKLGFHQYDVYGNLFGLLAAHPVTPLVSLHHLDVSLFPNVTRVQALQRLKIPMQLDSAGLMQQSICYDKTNGWTVSVSWGFAIQIFREIDIS